MGNTYRENAYKKSTKALLTSFITFIFATITFFLQIHFNIFVVLPLSMRDDDAVANDDVSIFGTVLFCLLVEKSATPLKSEISFDDSMAPSS